MNKTEIIIIEDNLPVNDPLILTLETDNDANVKVFKHSQDGLDYILSNLEKKLIVILDINFAPKEKNGHTIFEEIRNQNKLIPIIIWTSNTGKEDDFSDFVNNHAFYYIPKTSPMTEMSAIVKDAVHHLNLDIATAIENWLFVQDDKDRTISISSNGKELSANDLINEIRLQTTEGREIEENLIQLTIDLIFRKKENI